MQRLLLLGLNHATAPVQVREKLAFNAAQRRAALEVFAARWPQAEAVLISTCNRVELYCARPVHGHPRREEMVQFLAELRGVGEEVFREHLYEKSEEEAVEHLFSVSASLDSMVLGETQILGQVRESYESARQAGRTGAVLNPLFQKALAVGKQVLSETGIGEGRLSIASVAVECAQQIFDSFADKTVLCIGAGKMAWLVLRHLAELAPRRLMVCNRSRERAEELAQRVIGPRAGAAAADGAAVGLGFDDLEPALVEADIVVSSTGAAEPVITRQGFEALLPRRRYRPIFLIDIALPRDVEASVGELENVYLYNLDDLQQVVSRTQAQRHQTIEAARAIVGRQVQQFVAAHRARELGPVIDRLYRRHHELAQEELKRTLNKLGPVSDAERAHLEELTRRIVNKLLHDPIAALRRSGELHGPTAQYLHALENLFRLPPEETQHDEAGPGGAPR